MKVEVNACNLSFFDMCGHKLMGLDILDGITVDKLTLSAALTMGLENVDVFYVVLGAEHGLLLDCLDGVDNQIREEDRVRVDKFAGHGGLGAVEKALVTETFHSDCEFVLDVAAGFAGCDFIASDYVGRMDLQFNELVCAFEQFSCKYNN